MKFVDLATDHPALYDSGENPQDRRPPQPVLVEQRLVERQIPLLVDRSTVGAQAALKEAS